MYCMCITVCDNDCNKRTIDDSGTGSTGAVNLLSFLMFLFFVLTPVKLYNEKASFNCI